ncbi:MAG: NADPH-dependent 7-cyano-7-deazaguanine reductase QueF [Rickettsiales bacterium]|nr:MAG: NADPH-dependent 7-cyano-7-deazaguanine reductase QueF [Rickettsiales bacterium]
MTQKTPLPLGQKTEYISQYDNSLLFSISRSIARDEIGLSTLLPFAGMDIWNCYEVSWLSPSGKPNVRIMRFVVAADSEYLIESKSLKLYLNSLNNSKFRSEAELLTIIERDLSAAANSEVHATFHRLDSFNEQSLATFSGINLDDLDVEISDYNVNSALLTLAHGNERASETLYSNLLKSNCLVTQQPDWASVQIQYSGRKISHESLLKYLISFRNHNEFHEQCVEHIFNDIMQKCSPDSLTVHAKYTRRGGVDINPYRSTKNPVETVDVNLSRDARQ